MLFMYDKEIVCDLVAHNYFHLNAEEIFSTCQDDIPKLAETIDQIISDIQRENTPGPRM